MNTSILKEGVKSPELNILGTDNKIHKIVNEKGTIEKVFRKVKAKTHVESDIIPYIMKDK